MNSLYILHLETRPQIQSNNFVLSGKDAAKEQDHPTLSPLLSRCLLQATTGPLAMK